MSTSRVLVLGGIRSGKSQSAEALLSRAEHVSYLATAATDAEDATWDARIAAHRDRRPEHWTTEEFGTDPYALAPRLSDAKTNEALLVDDLGGWLTAVLSDVDGWSDPGAADDAVDALVKALADSPAGQVVLVSPEVGLSVVPATAAGRTFADALGRLNRAVAEICTRVALVVAGQPTWLKNEPPKSAAVSIVDTAEPGADTDGKPEISTDLPLPDEGSAAAAVAHLRGLDFAGAGLGALAEIVSFAGGTQQRDVPKPWEHVRVLLLHAAHAGNAAAGDDPVAVDRRRDQTHEGTGAIALLAAAGGATVTTVACPDAEDMEHTDALTADAVDQAISHGWRLAETAADSGADVLVLGALSVGSEAAAVAVTALTAGGEPAALLDRVAGADGFVDDNAWMRRCLAVRDALHRVRARARDAKTVLAAIGGGDIAVATGVILGAAFRRTPVLIDGPVGIAAGLVARDLGPQSRLWLALADHGGHPLVRFGGDVLGLNPLLHLRLRLGEGATSLAALPLLRAALTLAAGNPPAPPTQQ
jgi:nicotinate-nucleotide--dimethylbenzimidazole phosphoribosyltransferase